MWLTDPKTGKKSSTLTIMITTWLIVILKYIIGGVAIMGWTFAPFDSGAAAALMGISSGLYYGRKSTDAK